MKFVATIVIMVIAAVAEASHIPSIHAHHGFNYAAAPVITYAAHHGPTVVRSNAHHAWVHHGYPQVAAYKSYAHHVPAAVTAYGGHWDHHHVPASVAVPVHHSATYVAANPGAVHKAPLAGHLVNQKSLNLASASGTW
ncbi:AAEL002212-PA [Aedes aegypti]|uniref:AAEL002212-PA n=2 Tax=Aedes aegypti TaxID=7159 RepID=A0A1S4F122_AEDAE|nr:adult cuticle protein 1 [Aedes aegypti]EAT46601.1 AAEL002212-PA [Aedes aegypti]